MLQLIYFIYLCIKSKCPVHNNQSSNNNTQIMRPSWRLQWCITFGVVKSKSMWIFKFLKMLNSDTYQSEWADPNELCSVLPMDSQPRSHFGFLLPRHSSPQWAACARGAENNMCDQQPCQQSERKGLHWAQLTRPHHWENVLSVPRPRRDSADTNWR